MFQGTGSDVGKSLMVSGICRALKNRNINTAPFKPQNMSNNAGVTIDGGEIGRAQLLQAKACGKDAHTDMNPVLLKPQSNTGSQVIVQGKVLKSVSSEYFRELKPELMSAVLDSFNRLINNNDIVVIEGAGSPAEVNLRDGDIANMGFALETNTPVILVVDVDRGGSIASIIGTMAVLTAEEKKLVKGYVINKFRGDIKLYDDALDIINKETGLKCFGVLPWFEKAGLLPAEDAVALDNISNTDTANSKKICVLKTPRISNFDDLDPLKQTDNIDLHILSNGEPIPSDCDMVLLVGSKSTISDLEYIKSVGWDIDIKSHHRRGGLVMGICGGYQMLGNVINDPNNIESNISSITGLGLLNVETTLDTTKQLNEYTGIDTITNSNFIGYEMHMGKTTGNDCDNPFSHNGDNQPDGAISKCGKVFGSYIHSIFNDDEFRSAFLSKIFDTKIINNSYDKTVEATLDELAEHIEKYLDMDGILKASRQ